MAVEIKVPSVGESITEGTLARWLKKDGDLVRADEPLYELETEKATTEVGCPSAGRLVIVAPQGQTVAIGSVVGRIESASTGPAAAGASAEKKPAGAAQKPSPQPARAANADKKDDTPAQRAPARSSASHTDDWLSPSARRLAADAGVDVSQLTGTGRGGRITKEDVQAYIDSPRAEVEEPGKSVLLQPAEAPTSPDVSEPATGEKASAGRERREPMSAIRLRIAERLVAARNSAAVLTTFNEADLSAVQGLRSAYKERFQKKHGVALGYMGFFVKACVEALQSFPIINARIDGNDIVYHNVYHIAIAVSTDKGLMVPVVRDADRLDLAGIEKAIAALADKARAGKISVGDLQGGTFTITNGGIFGSLLSTPLLNPPQSAILGMHAIQKRPIVVSDQVVARPMMYLALSYDHRIVDGREAVQFLVRVKECIESPERLYLAV